MATSRLQHCRMQIADREAKTVAIGYWKCFITQSVISSLNCNKYVEHKKMFYYVLASE